MLTSGKTVEKLYIRFESKNWILNAFDINCNFSLKHSKDSSTMYSAMLAPEVIRIITAIVSISNDNYSNHLN